MQELELAEDESGYSFAEWPACKEVIFNTDNGCSPCKHVKMIYADCCGEFAHYDDDLEKVAQSIMDGVNDGDLGIAELMDNFAQDNGCKIYTITQYGMACGPCSTTDYYMIELPKKARKTKKSKK